MVIGAGWMEEEDALLQGRGFAFGPVVGRIQAVARHASTLEIWVVLRKQRTER